MTKHSRNVHLNESIVAILISVAALWACSSAQTVDNSKLEELRAITVCDLLKGLPAYNGKMVTVTGIYWLGLRQHCAEPLITGGHIWPSALELVDSDFVAKRGESVGFRTDREDWDRLDELTIREGKAGRREEIWVTIHGELQAPKAYVREDGQVVGGHGHMGVYPAQLVVQSISNTEIKPTPTYDYKDLLKARPR